MPADRPQPGDAVAIVDHAERRRYELDVGGEPVGILSYRTDGRVIDHRHTEIKPSFGGRGLGSALVRFALDDARMRGLSVRPSCPFVAAFIDRHPQYRDLLAR